MSEPAPQSKMDNAGVKVPPPVIYAGTLAAALAVDLILGGPTFGDLGVPRLVRIALGIALFLAGMLVAGAGVSRFRDAGTEIRPWLASTALVTTGVYRFTRNPMYLGLALLYAALALLADSIIALACLVPLLIVITHAVIRREEHYLEVIFGEDYRVYKRKVRRWI